MMLHVPYLALATLLTTAPIQDFEAELEALIAELPAALQDEAALEALDDRAGELDDRIRAHWRGQRSSLSDAELERFRRLEDEVEAFEDVVGAVGQTSNSADVELADWELANERLGLEWEVVHSEAPGREIVRVDVGSFSSYLVRNATGESWVVDYVYTTPSGEEQLGSRSAVCGTLTALANSRVTGVRELDLTEVAWEAFSFADPCGDVDRDGS